MFYVNKSILKNNILIARECLYADLYYIPLLYVCYILIRLFLTIGPRILAKTLVLPVLGSVLALFHGSLDHEPPNPQTPKANPSGQKPPFWGHLWRVCMRVPLIIKELSRHKRQDSANHFQN